jgi:acetylornithine deacetylase
MTCSELLARMIGIDSVNSAISGRPRAEEQLAGYLEDLARSFGLAVRRLPVPGHADNLLITCQKGDGASWLLFESHLDTVGVEGMSIDPFAARVEDGRVHGRGACDTKGSAAAMLWALRAYASESDGPNNVALLLSVDEEVSRAGVDAFVRDHLPRLDWRPIGAVVGEPTRLRVVAAHRGSVRMSIQTEGIAAHSADPSRGRSAIRMMMKVLDALENTYIPSLDANHPLAGPAVCSVNVIRGGSQINVVPSSCEIQVDRRTVPGESTSGVVAEIENVLAEVREANPEVKVSAHSLLTYEPLDPAAGKSLAERVGAVLEGMGLPGDATGAGYGSDAATLALAGVPSIVLGPGDIAQAHSADEWLALDELEKAVDAYLGIMRSASLTA